MIEDHQKYSIKLSKAKKFFKLMHHPALLIFVKITVFSLMLAIGLNISFEKMLSFWRQPSLLFLGLLGFGLSSPCR